MHGRKPVSTRALAATLALAAVLGGCRDNASTGPSHVQSKDFAAALRSVQGDQQVGGVGTALAESLQVKVVDANGLPVEGATVTFAVRAGGGAIIPPANVSSSTGFVSAVWILGTTLGANKAVAILTNGFVLDSAVFSATAVPGLPALLTKVSGDTQTTRVGHALAAPLIVKLTDQYGYVRSGVRVTWTPGLSSGSLAPLADTTGADGTAQARWTLGTQVISQSATASVTGTAPVVFTATSTADSSRVILPVSGNAQAPSPVSQALPIPLKIRITDQYGNPIAGEQVIWNDSIAGGGSVNPTAGLSGADGTAQTTWTLGGHVGPQFLRAKHALSGVTFNFTATATVQFSDVFAGNFMACGIAATNNQAYCWGVGDGGQLGKGTLTNASAPSTPVSTSADTVLGPFLQVRQISGGRDGFCSLTIDRRLYCWGRVIGQSGATVNFATFQPIVTGSTNQQILPNHLAVGEEHICILDLSGVAFCTGVDVHGELGDGAAPASPSVGTYPCVAGAPFGAADPASPVQGWSNIVAGQNHTCGVPRFNNPLVPPGPPSQVPLCWGLNTSGQVGNNALSSLGGQKIPAAIAPLPAAGAAFDSLSISAGSQHTCAIAVAPAGIAGNAYCWGANGFGQLGTGVPDPTVRDSVPTLVTGGIIFAKLYAGENHTCGLTATGGAWCWGRDDYGQLGDGAPTAFGGGRGAPVQVGGGLTFRSLSLGELYTCGLATAATQTVPSAAAGTIYCWGDNLFGQIGNGTAANNAPVLVPTKVLYQP